MGKNVATTNGNMIQCTEKHKIKVTTTCFDEICGGKDKSGNRSNKRYTGCTVYGTVG